MKFATKFTTLVLSIVIVSISTISLFVYLSNKKTLESELVSKLEYRASMVIDDVDRFMYERMIDLNSLSTRIALILGSPNPEGIQRDLIDYRNVNKNYISLSYFDLAGVRIADTTGIDIGGWNSVFIKSPYWDSVLEGKASTANFIGDSDTLKITVIFFAKPVYVEGKMTGVLIARVALSKLYEITKLAAGTGREAQYAKIELIDKNGLLLYSNYNRAGILKEKTKHYDILRRLSAGEEKGSEYCQIEGEGDNFEVFSAEKGYLDFKGNGWTLIVSVPADVIFAPAIKLRDRLIGILLAVAALAVLAVLFFSRSFTGPVTRLNRAVSQIGHGNWDVKIEVESKDEIGKLADAFKEMISRVKEKETQILQEKVYSEGIISSMIDTLIVITPEGNIKDVNQATLSLLGYTKDGLIGKPVGMILAEEEILFKGKKLEKLMRDGQVRNFEMTYKTKSGELIPVSFSGAVMYESSEPGIGSREFGEKTISSILPTSNPELRTKQRIVGIVGIARDMRQVKALIGDLEGAKKAVEDFAKDLEKKVEERTKDLYESQQASLYLLEDIQVSKEELEKRNVELGKAKVEIEVFSKGLEEKVKERTAELSILYEVSNAISYTLDYQTLLKLIMESLFKIVKYDICASLLFDAHSANIVLRPAYSQSAKFVEKTKNGIVDSTSVLTGENIGKKQMNVILIPYTADTAAEEVRDFDKLRSFFNVPFVVQGKTMGMINVSSCKENAFTENDIRLIYTIANQASSAISRLQAVITAEKSKMDSMVESMTEGVVMIDERDEVVVINPKAKELLGFAVSDEVNGANFYDKLRALNIAKDYEICKGTNKLIENEIIMPRERDLIVKYAVGPVKNSDGNIIGIVFILRDITKEKELSQMKTEFVSIVSHELRTPLAITKEGINVVLDGLTGEISENQKKYLTVANDNVDRLTRPIDGLLDISKLESGKMAINKSVIDIVSMIKEIGAAFAVKMKDKALELKYDLPDKLIDVFADRDKITQVLINLIGNSLKFTDKGYIEVSVTEKESEVECVVADTGKGISREDIPYVFEKFRQFGRTYGPGDKGTGLGLSISKGIIEKHGGIMRVESEFSKGSRFIFTLPKYTDERAFMECIFMGMQTASDSNSKMSVISILPENLNKAAGRFPGDELRSFMLEIGNVVKSSLRRQCDMVIKCSEEAVVLVDCDKENAVRILGRLEQTLDNYLEQKGLSAEVKLRFAYATYPDDGRTVEAIMKKIL